MKTIFIVFTDNVATPSQIRRLQKYSFNTNSELVIGDILKSPKYTTKMQVVDVLEKSYKYYNKTTGEISDELTSSNQYEIVQLELRNEVEEIVYANKVTA